MARGKLVRSALAFVVLTLATSGSAFAHTVGLSRGDYRIAGANVDVELVFARPELAAAVPTLDADHDGAISELEMRGARRAIEDAIVHGVVVRGASTPCSGGLRDLRLTEQDGISVHGFFRCAHDPASVAFDLPFLGILSHGHRHLVTAGAGSTTVRHVAYSRSAAFQVVVPHDVIASESGAGIWPLFRLGIEHILTGYDHLVFLFGLILVGGRLRSLLVVVTAFTIAHSITLGLAAFDILRPSVAFVEPAIALSIAYIGVENWFVTDASRRWLITFPFGLVHGFGFAGALQQISLPDRQIPLALAAFNGGVEAGQLGILVIVLPAILWLRGHQWFAVRGVRTMSSAIAVAGLWWFVMRVY
jgi:hydrogenase/urease accessory protein HupE